MSAESITYNNMVGHFQNMESSQKKSEIDMLASRIANNELDQKNLDLGKNGFKDGDMTPVFKALSLNKTLNSLSVGDNDLGDQDGKSLALALRVNSTLTSIIFDATHMSQETKEELIQSVRESNFSLTLLIFHDRHFLFGNELSRSRRPDEVDFQSLGWELAIRNQQLSMEKTKEESNENNDRMSTASPYSEVISKKSDEDSDHASDENFEFDRSICSYGSDFEQFSGPDDFSESIEHFSWNQKYY